jgi:hypothetical protein
MTRRPSLLLAATAAAVLLARPALAGPPLLCFPFEIGGAKSLPVGTGDWHAVDAHYDASHVVEDTLALLTPQTPIVVRMETIRRATLYASKSPTLAEALLSRLQERATISNANTPLAVFDFGYLVETYKQGSFLFGGPMKAAQGIDGYTLVVKASAMRDDPGIEFALAVMTRGNTRTADAYRTHLARAVKGAAADPSIQANLSKQFGADAAQR